MQNRNPIPCIRCKIRVIHWTADYNLVCKISCIHAFLMKHSSLCSLSMSHRVLQGTLSSPGKGQFVKVRLILLLLVQLFIIFYFFLMELVKLTLAMTSQGKREWTFSCTQMRTDELHSIGFTLTYYIGGVNQQGSFTAKQRIQRPKKNFCCLNHWLLAVAFSQISDN